MALIEAKLAEQLIDLRLQQSLGHEYAPISDICDALEGWLHAEQRLRALTTNIADAITT